MVRPYIEAVMQRSRGGSLGTMSSVSLMENVTSRPAECSFALLSDTEHGDDNEVEKILRGRFKELVEEIFIIYQIL